MVAKVTLPVPDTMSFADAATLGVGSYVSTPTWVLHEILVQY
jgi:hypothetical protein